MKVIDAMIKISRGEKVRFEILNNENHIYSTTNGRYLHDETSEEDVYWFIDEDWLNREIKLIEEDKKIRKIKVNYSPDIDEEIFYEDEDKLDHCVLGDAGTKLLINKINEIIDKINGEKEN